MFIVCIIHVCNFCNWLVYRLTKKTYNLLVMHSTLFQCAEKDLAEANILYLKVTI